MAINLNVALDVVKRAGFERERTSLHGKSSRQSLRKFRHSARRAKTMQTDGKRDHNRLRANAAALHLQLADKQKQKASRKSSTAKRSEFREKTRRKSAEEFGKALDQFVLFATRYRDCGFVAHLHTAAVTADVFDHVVQIDEV